MTAWLAVRHGDAGAERTAPERVIAADPTDFRALDRLIALAVEAQADEASLRRREGEPPGASGPVSIPLSAEPAARDAVEMARLAEQLGEPFEGRAFLRMAVVDDPDRGDLRRELDRLNRVEWKAARPGRTLADSLDVEFDSVDSRRRWGPDSSRKFEECQSFNSNL